MYNKGNKSGCRKYRLWSFFFEHFEPPPRVRRDVYLGIVHRLLRGYIGLNRGEGSYIGMIQCHAQIMGSHVYVYRVKGSIIQ